VSFSTDPRRPAAESDAPARRILLLFAASLVAVGLGGLVFVTVNKESITGGSNTVADSVAAGIGPQAGIDLAGYSDERSADLASATGERAAVVSFRDYLSEAQARAAVGDAEVVSLLAAVPGGLPGVVEGGVAEWVDGQVAEKRTERDEIRQLLPTVDDPQFEAFYEQEIERLDALLADVTADGPLVFAVVVLAPASDLQALATNPLVRMVDVAASADVEPGAPLRGLRPEETVQANDPPTRPV